MQILNQILIPVLWLAGLGAVFGVVLAFASKIFYVKRDERAEAITAALPGANCGGCSYAGCSAYADAVVAGDAGPNKCSAGGASVAAAVAEIMGLSAGDVVRVRAQVMCSGTLKYAKKKYLYSGVTDCAAAARLGGGDKICPNGCMGLGTCVNACKFGAIKVKNGVAVVDYRLCAGCGMCTKSCPKRLIALVPWNSAHWVVCKSVNDGATTRKYCDVGCISCHRCEKVCEAGAVTVNDYVASIDYSKCVACDKCVAACPRKIIWSAKQQGDEGLVITRTEEEGM